MKFADAARPALADPTARRALRQAVTEARERQADAVAELPDWQALRAAGAAIRERTLNGLADHLEKLEAAVTEAGGVVHWARDAAQARRIVRGFVAGEGEVGVVPSVVTREIGLDGLLRRAGAGAAEPGPGTKAVVTGVVFVVAESGTLVVAEPGDAVTFPRTLVAVAGLEDVVPEWADLDVLLQLLPRFSVGLGTHAGMSAWTPDGTRDFHLVLLDNGRTRVLADPAGREALRCIHCSACHHVCPVYERTGPEPYGPGRAGPIGAVLGPQMAGVAGARNASLPFASTLCGACADVCPVKIDIPGLLVHLRGEVVESRRGRPVPTPEALLMRGLAWSMGDERRYEQTLMRRARWARLFARDGLIRRLPGLFGKWTDARDLPAPPRESFRTWWRRRP